MIEIQTVADMACSIQEQIQSHISSLFSNNDFLVTCVLKQVKVGCLHDVGRVVNDQSSSFSCGMKIIISVGTMGFCYGIDFKVIVDYIIKMRSDTRIFKCQRTSKLWFLIAALDFD